MTITLIVGGARSGKSRYAEGSITSRPGPWTYIATAQAFDQEMAARIAAHRASRVAGWRTVEAPLTLPETMQREAKDGCPILVDCLTLWLSNLVLTDGAIEAESKKLLAVLGETGVPIVLVSNEVGMGIVPDNALARAFRDHQGRLNQQVAAIANTVVFMAAGLPMFLKGSAP